MTMMRLSGHVNRNLGGGLFDVRTSHVPNDAKDGILGVCFT